MLNKRLYIYIYLFKIHHDIIEHTFFNIYIYIEHPLVSKCYTYVQKKVKMSFDSLPYSHSLIHLL